MKAIATVSFRIKVELPYHVQIDNVTEEALNRALAKLIAIMDSPNRDAILRDASYVAVDFMDEP